MRLRPRSAVLLAAIAALLAGCGDDEDAATTAGAAPDLERYCELSEELDAVGAGEFEDLAQDPVAAEDIYVEVEREMVQEHEDLLAEIQEVAPEEILEDLEIVLRVIETRAGLHVEGPSPAELAAAERAIGRFENDNCPGD